MINWSFYPKFKPIPHELKKIIKVFEKSSPKINSESNHLKSNEVLTEIRRDLEDIGFDDYVYGQGVSFIEWADHIIAAIPEERMLIEIELTGDEDRLFKCSAHGETHEAVLRKFMDSLK